MRLVLLKCSSRKRGGAEPIPAIERYDSPLWRVLRSYLRAEPQARDSLDIYGLSPEYGLIEADALIPRYEGTMAPERADELRPMVLAALGPVLGRGYNQLCLGMSARYLRAMEGWEALVPQGVAVTCTDGAMGEKLAQLRAWLEGRVWNGPSPTSRRLAASDHPRGEAVLSGVRLQLSREDVLSAARAALLAGADGATRYRDWYVLVDGRPVSAKWLAGVISGLRTSRFDAASARQALLALGLDVERRGPTEGDA